MKKWRTFSIKSLLIITALSAVFVAYRIYQFEHGVINRWIDAVLVDLTANPLPAPISYGKPRTRIGCPNDIPASQQIRLLTKSLRWLPTDERRNCVLKIIAEQFPDEAHDFFIQISKEMKHELVLRNTILLSSLFRLEEDIAHFETFLDHQSDLIRSAAVDAIGVVHQPSFPMPAGYELSHSPIVFRSKPEIDLLPICEELFPQRQNRGKGGLNELWFVNRTLKWKDKSARNLSSETRERIQQLLQNDTSHVVRSAAARACKNWNPTAYKMRVAEWGVWINEGENLTLAQSIVDEIPTFVHRVGNDMKSISQGRSRGIVITKPIIHFTVDKQLVVDIDVRIKSGRPWFGYPKPDDFATAGTARRFGRPPFLGRDASPELKLKNLEGLREGYPWLLPSHTKKSMNYVTDVGFRWQSLLVTPKQYSWMSLEPISAPKFKWWNIIREVETSWVSNRGETERFLYYDGPTDFPSPVKASIEGDKLKIAVPNAYYINPPRGRSRKSSEFVRSDPLIIGAADGRISESSQLVKRTHFFINVAADKISASTNNFEFETQDIFKFQSLIGTRSQHLGGSTEFSTLDLPHHDEEVELRLVQLLVEHGLSPKEAQGLVDCWRPQFFETQGRRLLTIFGKKEYDQLCPISISPTPTQLCRVGIVLTEFGEND